jgi:glycerophosphoryl diester phosphodiesterase
VTVPHVIAHRGSSASLPDNTWAAFEAAVVEGADAIECDVVATHDDELVIRHDLAIDGRFVRDLSFTELKTAAPESIRLGELLSWAETARIALLVEIKEPDLALAAATMIGETRWQDQVTVGGFHGPALAAIKRVLSGIRTSFMIGSVVGADEVVQLARAYRVDGVHLCWEARASHPHRLLDTSLVEGLRRAGLAITLWHEEREDELRALVAFEPDAICTNTPAVLRRVVDAHRTKDSKPVT